VRELWPDIEDVGGYILPRHRQCHQHTDPQSQSVSRYCIALMPPFVAASLTASCRYAVLVLWSYACLIEISRVCGRDVIARIDRPP
jgi:hypothetical protein